VKGWSRPVSWTKTGVAPFFSIFLHFSSFFFIFLLQQSNSIGCCGSPFPFFLLLSFFFLFGLHVQPTRERQKGLGSGGGDRGETWCQPETASQARHLPPPSKYVFYSSMRDVFLLLSSFFFFFLLATSCDFLQLLQGLTVGFLDFFFFSLARNHPRIHLHLPFLPVIGEMGAR